MRDALSEVRMRRPDTHPRKTRLSGLQPLNIDATTGFVHVGERTNVTGSARFRRLIEADDYAAAVQVARQQVESGANVLDVNMDAGLLDSESAMRRFNQPAGRRTGHLPRAGHGRLVPLGSADSGTEVPAGQGRGQFDQPQERR